MDNTTWLDQQLRRLRDDVLWALQRAFGAILAREDETLLIWHDQAARHYVARYATLRREMENDLLRHMYGAVNSWEAIAESTRAIEQQASAAGAALAEAECHSAATMKHVESARRAVSDAQSHALEAEKRVGMALALIQEATDLLSAVPTAPAGTSDGVFMAIGGGVTTPSVPAARDFTRQRITHGVAVEAPKLQGPPVFGGKMMVTESDLAATMSAISGMSYENSVHVLHEEGTFDRLGNLRTETLDRVAGRMMISNSAFASALSKHTGRLVEDVYREIESSRDRMHPTYRHGWGG